MPSPTPILPPGPLNVTDPTTLDIATLVIAILAALIALLSLYLTVRRDRALGRVSVRMVIDYGAGDYANDARVMAVHFSNPERRTVSVQRAGLALRRGDQRRDFAGWGPIFVEGGFGGLGSAVSPFSDGIQLEPGAPAERVRASLFRVRGAFFPDLPAWVWCEDSIGGVYWAPIPAEVRSAIAATKRRVASTPDRGGHTGSVEVEDDEVIRPDALYQHG